MALDGKRVNLDIIPEVVKCLEAIRTDTPLPDGRDPMTAIVNEGMITALRELQNSLYTVEANMDIGRVLSEISDDMPVGTYRKVVTAIADLTSEPEEFALRCGIVLGKRK